MDKFKIGQLCRIVKNPCEGAPIGAIAEILTQRSHRAVFDGNNFINYFCYLIEIGGIVFGAAEDELEPLEKPHREMDEIVSWDECLWKPKQVTA